MDRHCPWTPDSHQSGRIKGHHAVSGDLRLSRLADMDPTGTDKETPQLPNVTPMNDRTEPDLSHLPKMSDRTEPDELDRILADNSRQNEFGMLSNPLLNLDRPKLRELGEAFAERYGLPANERGRFADAAILAQNNEAWREPDTYLQLDRQEEDLLDREKTHRWQQPRKLWSLIFVCAASAAVQGWDQ